MNIPRCYYCNKKAVRYGRCASPEAAKMDPIDVCGRHIHLIRWPNENLYPAGVLRKER